MLERRDTKARCFLFGDRRSVEATLAAWAAWRNPNDPSQRVCALVLRGDPGNLLATAAGIRAVEMLRGAPFGFELRAELADSRGPALDATGAMKSAPGADAIYLVVDTDVDDGDESSRKLRESLRTRLEGLASAAPVLWIARENAGHATRLVRTGRIEHVRTDLPAPLMSPLVEGILTGMRAEHPDAHLVVCGQGPRVVQLALGAGDVLIEYDGGPPDRLDHARMALLARRVLVPPTLTARTGATLAKALRALDVTTVAVSGRAPEGLVMEPLTGVAQAA